MKCAFVLLLSIVAFLPACKNATLKKKEETLFKLLPSSATHIDFENKLEHNDAFNIYTYRNFYNGGGVSIGDVNKDGLPDIYFTANMGRNKLYLNKGNFQFEDITDKAGVAGTKAWSTGVTMADVNGDGLIDIYVCNSGDIKGDNKQNELFINNGNLTFTERAEAYGLADKGYSTHAVFFDYDKDGDLDLYLLNNSYKAIGSFNLQQNQRSVRDSLGGDKLFGNDNGHFTDVSAQAGIYGSEIGFGLGVTVGDVNKDGWPDIYVSNDFFERDYLYINSGNGTFTEDLENEMGSISYASMGADMADINNDAYPDIFVTEMLPDDEGRLKTLTSFENWDKFQYNIQNGYYRQSSRNMLHLNTPVNPDSRDSGINKKVVFSEIGRLAGVEATDWSWGALITDMDNDGYKDIFVANGIYKDLTNQDYINYISNEEVAKSIVSKKGVDFKKLIDIIPSTPLSNYAFINNGNRSSAALTFTNKAKEMGLDDPGFSNGAAYADLDNDGDMDLVVNNVNMPAFVYRNDANRLLPNNNFLKVKLIGEGKNTAAIGTKLTIQHQGHTFYLEQILSRGFESFSDDRPNFGLGAIRQVDTLLVQWPDGKVTLKTNVATNQTLVLNQKDAVATQVNLVEQDTASCTFSDITGKVGIDYTHKENAYSDFDQNRLLFQMLSTQGPKLCKGDVNGDGLEDFFVGGAKDQPGALFIQTKRGGFVSTNKALFEQDKGSEDTKSLLFDADNDGDLDLYVASGGVEFSTSSSALISRLYINDGKGNFIKSPQLLPTGTFESSSTVQCADYDGDGDLDLFVGIRSQPFLYGVPTNGYILQNDGKGHFTNVTNEVAPQLHHIGMITDAAWIDIDNDKDLDLVVVGEWMPVKVFENHNGKFVDITEKAGLSKTNGWWNCMAVGDFNNDGYIDFVVGNHGLNSRCKASLQKPATMYVNDFDQNGAVEQIICTYNGAKSYPIAPRQDIMMELPFLKKKYLTFESFKYQTVTDMFSPEQLKKAVTCEAYDLQSSVFINNRNGTFMMKSLGVEAQFAPVCGLLVKDLDKDGNADILLGGNLYAVKPEAGAYDASYGSFLKGDGNGGFASVPLDASHFMLQGEVRDIMPLHTANGCDLILVARNNQPLQVFSTAVKKISR